MTDVYRLIISCPDRTGIVAVVAELISKSGGTIIEANHHTDKMNKWFFMRHEILAKSLNITLDKFKHEFAILANKFNMQWQISDSKIPKKIALFASKDSHCLADLLHRWHEKDLPGDISCIISNHIDLEEISKWYQVPFYHIPVTENTKLQDFKKIEHRIKQHEINTIVLARYMQILPPNMCQQFYGHIINIHHSFLPSFIGAKPYHQAYERGVKLIGATCHYVTQELDAGPIIEQDVIRVNHAHSIEDLKRLGRDVEKTVLSRGLRHHLEDRILIHGNKTVVFST